MLRKRIRSIFFDLNIYMNNQQLTIADMESLKALIEAACLRGAFRAPEMSKIGPIYDKLSNFIEYTSAQIAARAPTAPTGEPNA
jgi:hypothetical protein